MTDYQYELLVMIVGIAATIALFLWRWHRLSKWVWFGLESAYGWLRTIGRQWRKRR